MSHTVLDGFVLGDAEKNHLLQLIQHYSSVYFTEILGFCIMGNHFHLVVRMHPGDEYSAAEIRNRYARYYQEDDDHPDKQPVRVSGLAGMFSLKRLSELT